MITLTLVLADGTTYSKNFRTCPRHWRSAALRLAPYGVSVHGSHAIKQAS